LRDYQGISNELVHAWSNIFGKSVNQTDDFFDLGGDSMTAIRMVSDLQARYGVEIDLEMFFNEPTITRLACAIVATPVNAEARRG
jgi:acyl carrier protein